MRWIIFWLPFAILPLNMFALWGWTLVTYYEPLRTTASVVILIPFLFVLIWKEWFGIRLRNKKGKRKKTRKIMEAVSYTAFFAVAGAFGVTVSLLFLNQTLRLDSTPVTAEYVQSSVDGPRTRKFGKLTVSVLEFRPPAASETLRVRRWPSVGRVDDKDGTVVVCHATGILGLMFYYYPVSGRCE